MSTKWLIGLIMLWGMFTVIAGICEQSTYGATEVGLVQQLMTQPEFTSTFGVLGDAYTAMSWAGNEIKVLWNMFWFNYPFFEGQWQTIRYIVFMPVSIGVIISMFFAIKGTSST